MKKTMNSTIQTLFAVLLCCITFNLHAQTPTLVRDINQDASPNGNPRGMTLSGSTVIFSANDAVHGNELWRTNGNAANTFLVKDINPSGNSNPANFCNLNGIVYFTATTPAEGTELWKTDGTAAGTVLVADVLPGTASSMISQLTACNGRVYFSAIKRTVNQVGVMEELKLFVSDGTPGGTGILDNAMAFGGPQNLTAVGATLFFSAFNSAIGTELWKANGLSTQLVRNINVSPAPASSNPRNFINVNGTLFFSADDVTNGRQVWKSNGTFGTTSRVSSLQTFGFPGAEIAEIAHVSGVVFFSAPIGILNLGNQIFKVNSAANGTTQIAVVMAQNLTAFSGRLFFTQSTQFNGSFLSSINSIGVSVVTDVANFPTVAGNDSGIPRNLIAASAQLFFTAGTTGIGRELWRTSGTTLGTFRVQDFVVGPTGAGISDLCVRSNEVFFASNGTGGNELRRSDGSLNGIITVRNIGLAGSFPTGFTKFGNFTYFAANDGINGSELWRTDGTPNGTELFKNIRAGSASSSPDNFLVVTASNGTATLFFVAHNGTHGRELWKSDGTVNGTIRISDIIVGVGNAGIGNMTNFNGVLHFTAASGLSTGDRIFRTNAALTGVITTGGSMSNANSLVAISTNLYFTQSPQIGGPQLCKLNNALTTIIKTFALIPGGQYPIPQQLTAVGSRLFFTAATADNGRELWKSLGSSASTISISEIGPGTSDAGIGNMTNFNGILHFTAISGTSLGDRIFKTNDNVGGVETTGGGQVQANDLVAVGTKLFFTQQSHQSPLGPSICFLEAGATTALKFFGFLPDGQYAGPLQLTAAGNKIFFTAADAINGREIWKADGTVDGTALVADMRPGIGDANVLTMKLCGNDLYVSLNTLEVGQEPYRILNAAQMQDDEADDRDAALETTQIETIAAPEIKVYPNPATNFVSVDLPATEMSGTLSLLTVSGQLIHEVQAAAGETPVKMDVQDLPRGIYIVRWVQSDEQVVVKKLIVQ